jgi:hypothetical protein
MTGLVQSQPSLDVGPRYACVFPEDVENPILVSSWFLKTHRVCGPTDEEASLDGPGGTQPLSILPAVVMLKGTPPLNKPGIPQLPQAKRHLDKHSGMTHGSTPPTWGQIKCLVDMARDVARGQGQDGTPTVLLLAMISIINQQVSPESAQGLVHWVFVPHPPLLLAVT